MNCQTQPYLIRYSSNPVKRTFEQRVCQVFNVTPEELRSNRKPNNIVLARYLIFHHLRTTEDRTLKYIGNMYNRDHSTVRSALSKFLDIYTYNVYFRKKCDLLL